MTQVSYKYRIYPTGTQEKQLSVFFGQVRFVWNYSLSLRSDLYEFRKESINYVGLSKHLTYLKKQESHAWLNECPSAPLQQCLIDQDKAFKSFFDKRGSYPRFKKKGEQQSMRLTLDQRHIDNNFKAGELLKLPKLGAIKVNWSRLPTGIPKMATISKDPVGKYWVSFSCEESITPKAKTKLTVGVDVGIKDVAVLSDGFHSGAPKYTYQYARKLKLAQRSLSRKKKGSNRYKKQRIAVARIHAKIANSRKDFLHKLSHKLVNEFDMISMEALNVKGMVKNRCLSKAVSDVGMFELKRQVQYKAAWHGKRVIEIGRFFPSTKMCCKCGQIHDMKLSDRWMSCDCGNEMDRDENAARNIEAEGNRLCVELDTNLSVLPGKQAVKRVPKIKPEPLYGTEVAA